MAKEACVPKPPPPPSFPTHEHFPLITVPIPGIYTYHPVIPGYSQAKFPGVVIFSEIYQGPLPLHLHLHLHLLQPLQLTRVPRDQSPAPSRASPAK